jgi:hypothetical protein
VIIPQYAQKGHGVQTSAERIPENNSPVDVPLLSLQGLLDLLDALQPELDSQGGLVSVFSIALREELVGVVGHD